MMIVCSSKWYTQCSGCVEYVGVEDNDNTMVYVYSDELYNNTDSDE